MHHFIPTGELGKELGFPGQLIRHRTIIGVSGGVFAVHVVQPRDDSAHTPFEPIGRLLGADPLGQLYIGWSDDFIGIVAELVGKTKPRRNGAAPFTSAWNAKDQVRDVYPWDRLAVSFLFREHPPNAYGTCITEYAVRFGEYPPLNEFGEEKS